jgi:hypothetical protein
MDARDKRGHYGIPLVPAEGRGDPKLDSRFAGADAVTRYAGSGLPLVSGRNGATAKPST